MKRQLLSSIKIITVACLLFNIFSCGQKKEDKAFIIFNEGVSLSIQSSTEQEMGNFEKAALLNKQSIDKFKETIKIDSMHAGARSALAHALYIDKQFQEAINWFEKAIKFYGEAAINYREKGLCKINLGQIQAGKEDIDKAFAMDTTKEIRDITIQDLIGIGDLAFSYGDGYTKQEDSKKGHDYKMFSIGVLMLAFQYDQSKKEVAEKITNYADKIGEKETADEYRKIIKQ